MDVTRIAMAVDSRQVRAANTELRNMQGSGQKAEKSVDNLGRTLAKGSAIAAAAIASVTAALGAMTVKGMKAVDEQAKLARAMDATADGIRAVQLAASDAGLDNMDQSLNRLNRRLGAAQMGQAQYAKSVDALGLSVEALQKMDADERLASIADAVRDSGMASQEAARHLQQLGFDQANANDFLRQGGDAIRAARDEIEDYGLSLSEIDTAQIEAANDAFARTSFFTERLQNKLAVEAAPFVHFLSIALTDATKEAEGLDDSITGLADRGANAMAFVADSVDGVRRAFVVAGQAQATWVLNLQRIVIGATENILSGPVDAINTLIETANRIRGVNLELIEQPDIVTGLQAELRLAEMAVEEGKKAMHATLMEPLPSVGILQAYEEAKVASREAAEQIVADREAEKKAAEGARDVNGGSAQVEQELEFLREQNRLIAEGIGIKEAAARVDEMRLALSLRSEGANEAQIAQMIELQNSLRSAEEGAQSIEYLTMSLERMRGEIDPAYAAMRDFQLAIVDLEAMRDADLIDSGQFDELYIALEKIHDITGSIGDSFGDMADESLKSLRIMSRAFDRESKGYAQMQVAIQAVNAAKAVNAVITQASDGDPYTAFARMATMAAAMASLGQSIGGLGGSFTDTAQERQDAQGTGSVLGSAEEKSESIARSSDITANATRELVGINRGMLNALQQLQAGIGGATTQIARGAGGLDFDYGGRVNANENVFSSISDILPGNNALLDIVGGWLGGSSKVTDEGVQILGGTMAEMMDDIMIQAFQETQSKKYAWSGTKTNEAFADLEEGVSRQFSLIFEGLAGSVSEGAQALGMSAEEINRAISEFEIETQMISLKDLDASEQQAELEAVFSSIFDGLAGDVIPFIDDFQRAGEGLGETLARVATGVQVTEQAIDRLGFSAERLGVEQFAELSTALIDASGGLDRFISGMGNFIDRFASESHKFEIAQTDITRALEGVGLSVPATRDGMWDLMQTLDANTEAGRQQIAALIELSGASDDYYSQLEKQQREAMRAMEGVARSLRSELSGLSSAGDQLRGGLGGDSRGDAVEVLRQAMLSGDLSGVGQAAQTAAQISPDDFSSLDEFLSEQARTLFLIDSLEREGKQQLTAAEQSLGHLSSIDEGIDDIVDAIKGGPGVNQNSDNLSSSAPIVNDRPNAATQSNAELIKEIRELKSYIKQTTKNTGETRDQLNRWNREGMPEERELV